MATSATTRSTSRRQAPQQPKALALEKGLPAAEVDRRLVALARVHRRVEAALCFYLHEVQERWLYLRFGHASTVDYARERLGFEERKTRALLFVAERSRSLPRIADLLRRGELPWTKVREVVKVARPETEQRWLDKCRTLSNRQLEEEVRKALPPVAKRTLVLILEGDALETWEQTREAVERLAGKSLSDMEVFDLMCAKSCAPMRSRQLMARSVPRPMRTRRTMPPTRSDNGSSSATGGSAPAPDVGVVPGSR
jgi:hypothetical protein